MSFICIKCIYICIIFWPQSMPSPKAAKINFKNYCQKNLNLKITNIHLKQPFKGHTELTNHRHFQTFEFSFLLKERPGYPPNA